MTVEAVSTPSAPETTLAPAAASERCPILAAKILKQVEFYFGDANLPRDRFLQEKVKENDGWVQLALLASFSRMKTLSEDVETIAAAVEKSEGLLELSEERTAVRRKTEVCEDGKDNLLTSVYVKGFPLTATLDDIEAVISGAFTDGKIQAIRMRRHPKTKEFKGSVFVELASAEEAERLAGMAISLPEAAEPLVMHVKAKYFELKNAERTKGRRPEQAEKEREERPFEYIKRCLLLIDAVPEGITFEQIKEALNAVRPVAFADIAEGVATIRFKEAMPEGETLPEGIATVKVGEVELTSRLANEEEEKKYYDAFLATLKAKSKQRMGNRRGGRQGGRPAKRQRN